MDIVMFLTFTIRGCSAPIWMGDELSVSSIVKKSRDV